MGSKVSCQGSNSPRTVAVEPKPKAKQAWGHADEHVPLVKQDSCLFTIKESRGGSMSPTGLAETWTAGNLISAGTNHQVHVGLHDSGVLVTRKLVTLSRPHVKTLRMFSEFYSRLQKVDSVHVAQCLECDVTGDTVQIFTKWAGSGSVRSMVHQFGTMKLDLARRITRHVLKGLHAMHSSGLLHLRVKPDNILVEHSVGQLYCSWPPERLYACPDPALAKVSRSAARYISPEAGATGVSSKSDIWSVGCLLLYMLVGTHPWKGVGDHADDLLVYIHKVKISPLTHMARQWAAAGDEDDGDVVEAFAIAHDLTPEVLSFLTACFTRHRSSRPSAAELLHHPFIQSTGSARSSVTELGSDRICVSAGSLASVNCSTDDAPWLRDTKLVSPSQH